jgi:hypothetical protein
VAPELHLPAGVCYATVHKHREDGRVVAVEQEQVFGTSEDLEEALGASTVSAKVNTSFLERQHGTDRAATRGNRGRRTGSARIGRSTRRSRT